MTERVQRIVDGMCAVRAKLGDEKWRALVLHHIEEAQQEARAAALEEAAKVAERHSAYLNVNAHIAIAKGIRALLEGK